MISTGARESEHPRMIANGSWRAMSSLRRAWLTNVSRLRTPSAKRRFPSLKRSSASSAAIIQLHPCRAKRPKLDHALWLGDEPALDITVEPNRLIELVCLLALCSG